MLRKPIIALIIDIDSAKRYVEGLVNSGLEFHLKDDPETIVDIYTGREVFTYLESRVLRRRIAQLYSYDWGDYRCPVGYLIHVVDYAKRW